jgi:hypothetical protein
MNIKCRRRSICYSMYLQSSWLVIFDSSCGFLYSWCVLWDGCVYNRRRQNWHVTLRACLGDGRRHKAQDGGSQVVGGFSLFIKAYRKIDDGDPFPRFSCMIQLSDLGAE